MFCPGCGNETHKFVSRRVEGKNHYACPGCESTAPKELKKVLARKRNTSPAIRGLEKFEVPKAERIKTKELAKLIPKTPDSPRQRDLLRNDSPKARAKIFIEGVGGMGGSRNKLAMQKLEKKLGPNPKILSDDGFAVLGEAA